MTHLIDTAQAYRNEAEAGIAIRESGLERKEIFITTKYSGLDGLDIKTSINNSLKNVGFQPQSVGILIYYLHSLEYRTWTCTSFTTRGSRSRISRLYGKSWRKSRHKAS